MMKKFGFLAVMLLLAAPAMAAFALPVVAQQTSNFSPFGGGLDTVAVQSTVYQFGNDFIYGYQILTGTVDVSWFSVEILPGAVVTAVGYDLGSGQPTIWGPVGTPIVSMDASFTAPITAGNASQMVWFISPQRWIEADGATGGITGGQYVTTGGTILTPIPEPATLAIFGLGAALAFGLRKKV
jgi:hypothetical protein